MKLEFFDVEIDEPRIGFGIRFCPECDARLIWRENYYHCDKCQAKKKETIKKWMRYKRRIN